jgi:predicted DNA-binding ribbon-helix-helix protein
MAKLNPTRPRKNRFGTPPPDSPQDLEMVEVPETVSDNPQDGRSLRKTGRTHPLATRVTPEFHRKLRQIAARDGLKIVELLERALSIYEEQQR